MLIDIDKEDYASKCKKQTLALSSRSSSPVKKKSREVSFQMKNDLVDITGAPVTPIAQEDMDHKPAAKPKKMMLEVAKSSKPNVTPIFIDPKKGKRAHKGHIDVNMKIPAVPKGGNPTDHFQCHFINWILMIQENVDLSFIIFAYLLKDLADELDALHQPKDLGKTLTFENMLTMYAHK